MFEFKNIGLLKYSKMSMPNKSSIDEISIDEITPRYDYLSII